MAYTKNPVQSTYDTKRISLVTNPQQRSSSPNKDARLVNFLVEILASPIQEAKRYNVQLRSGMESLGYTTTETEPRGCYYWDYGSGYLFWVAGDTVYANNTSVLTLNTSTGPVGFTEYLDDTGTKKLILVDGTDGYVFTDSTTYTSIVPSTWLPGNSYAINERAKPNVANGLYYIVTIDGESGGTEPIWPTVAGNTVVDGTVTWEAIDGSFPTPHIPSPVFLDGYVFLPKENSQDVYNSNLNDPTAWTAGEFISAEMFPDTIQKIVKTDNYICVVGRTSCEFLYDAANSTGSPLARNDSFVQDMGTPAPHSVVSTEKEILFVSQAEAGGYTVTVLEGAKSKEIGIPAVISSLNADVNIADATAFYVKTSGQRLYVLVLTDSVWVFSLTSGFWTEFDSEHTFAFGCDNGTGFPALQIITSDGIVDMVSLTPDTNLDLSEDLTGIIVTSKFDFDSINRKSMGRLSILSDAPNGSTNVPITVQWSDDDYNTWSVGRTLQLNTDIPAIHQLGMFRRRAFKFTYSAPYPIRIEGIEVDINKGNS